MHPIIIGILRIVGNRTGINEYSIWSWCLPIFSFMATAIMVYLWCFFKDKYF